MLPLPVSRITSSITTLCFFSRGVVGSVITAITFPFAGDKKTDGSSWITRFGKRKKKRWYHKLNIRIPIISKPTIHKLIRCRFFIFFTCCSIKVTFTNKIKNTSKVTIANLLSFSSHNIANKKNHRTLNMCTMKC